MVEYLQPGESVTVDKGYLVPDLLQGSGVQLKLFDHLFLNIKSSSHKKSDMKVGKYPGIGSSLKI